MSSGRSAGPGCAARRQRGLGRSAPQAPELIQVTWDSQTGRRREKRHPDKARARPLRVNPRMASRSHGVEQVWLAPPTVRVAFRRFDPKLDARVGVAPAVGGHHLRQDDLAPRLEGQFDTPLRRVGRGEVGGQVRAAAASVSRFRCMGSSGEGQVRNRPRMACPLRKRRGQPHFEGDFNPSCSKATCSPSNGRRVREDGGLSRVDRAGWFPLEEALQKVTKGQRPIIVALAEKLGAGRR